MLIAALTPRATFHSYDLQNPELLWTLYLEKDLSSYQIHRTTKSRCSRAAISDAIRLVGIKKEVRKPPILRFGWKQTHSPQG